MSTLVDRSVDLKTISAVPARTHLSIAAGIGFNEWRKLGAQITRMGDSAKWWIGDWLCYGECYRRDYRAAMEQVDREYDALRSYKLVAAHVESATRVADLSWTHHRLVASLEPPGQRRWLNEALRQGWTTRELEQAMNEEKEPSQRPPALTVRAVDELYALCTSEAQRVGVEPADWASEGLRWLAEQGSPHVAEAAA